MTNYKGVVGIDLGTTNSVVTRITDEGEFKHVKNKDGRFLTPSFIWVKEDGDGGVEFNVGDLAKEKMSTDPTNVLSSYKTHMGTNRTIKEILGKPMTAQHCSILALRYMKDGIEEELDEAVIKAVVTVPAYFNESQKTATHTAARMSGMDILGIIPEPTASALYYTQNHDIPEEGKMVLVYDIGGGTFDISIVYVTKDNATVQAIDGDRFLGGDDFDSALRIYAEKMSGLYKKLDRNKTEILTRRCEQAKRELMDKAYEGEANPTSYIKVDDLGSTETEIEITLEQFNKETQPLVDKTLSKIDNALEKSQLPKEMIEDVILVGGSSRLYGIRKSLVEYFDGKFDNEYFNRYLIDPDLAISGGAAIYAKLIIDGKESTVSNTVPMPLGVKDANGDMVIILRDGALIPARGSKSFSTNRDNQEEILIEVFEGTSTKADNNTKIGELRVPVPRNTPKGKYKPTLMFNLTNDGLLKVRSIGDTVHQVEIDREHGNLEEEMDDIMNMKSDEELNRTEEITNEIVEKNDESSELDEEDLGSSDLFWEV